MRNGFLGRIGEAGAVGWPPGASPALSSGGGGVPTAIQPSPKMQPPMGVPASAVGGAVASAGVSHHFFHCQPCTCVCSTGLDAIFRSCFSYSNSHGNKAAAR